MEAAQTSMPIPVEGCLDVYHCGYHSELSFGAASYFIRRPEGNILMDSPRFTPALVKGLEVCKFKHRHVLIDEEAGCWIL